ncbi:hypothetical protein K2173_019494 [Erythroxylum novogranatense]|uniref:Uncharacterized protein n=1 Tax=Erythroxylum novogranatense TaxID=1862640 RepID=A0AAV8UBF0_9ROSI|nr:hypothetical protein K2173_019494 [Erythroxylum novogranatense]
MECLSQAIHLVILLLNTILDDFCQSSGQAINIDKTLMYCSPNVSMERALSLSSLMGVRLVADLGKYLGAPLLHGRFSKTTYQDLTFTIRRRVDHWRPDRIALAGRSVLCQSILQSIPGYLLQCTALPKGVLDSLDRVRRSFLWGTIPVTKKLSLVAWDMVCQPKNRGGLGLRKLRNINTTFLLKLAWGLIFGSAKLYYQVLKAKYGWPPPFPSPARPSPPTTVLWRQISLLWSTGLQCIRWSLGDGRTTGFWLDRWLDADTRLIDLLTAPLPPSDVQRRVASYTTTSGQWNWGDIRPYLLHDLLFKIAATPPPHAFLGPDRPSWLHTATGSFSTASAMRLSAPLPGTLSKPIGLMCGTGRARLKSKPSSGS